ncbi:Z-ring formation inhibitor MciZ [Paenibacillus sepulcri]|uniref:Z-ring formation inhibitor MciZ n=1 Tax=Paenibacillus sepulcri TaxID=359917 RepID=A0ABS7CE67_9BACL|nr:Z-ring formation inhibitor MciZ [Paenibacillus sepulcri]
MKQYSFSSQLTLVGKAWEIRHQLKLMVQQSPAHIRGSKIKSAGTLGDYLEHRRPASR